ncbi:MAG: Eco57I restriction-modification methylase domain-containing protein [Selenomonadaceae bacterium]|nr:Eco57I restriction-modification methylase domain-containing protein [Selenomonadaceae bacterium]
MINFNAPPLKDVLEILLRGVKISDPTNIKPRALKSADEKFFRTRSIAEVFTPSRLVKFMVDALDDENLYWQLRLDSKWLEMACGEAPFITNRYDAETGSDIPFNERAGILDKKLRAIPAAADKIFWAKRAVQSVYGYELQTDSLLIARANVLLTFAEFVEDFSADDLSEVAQVISRNFWKMDALNLPPVQISLFDDALDWSTGEEIFLGGTDMKKFDYVISNPPYQDDTPGGNKTFAPPIYHHFMNAARKISDKAVFITPARFLFDAGGTPKDFNRRMLNDPHFKVLDYAPDAKKYFRNVDIEGGVAVTLRDDTKNFGAIGTFTAFEDLNSIHKKVCVDNKDFRSLNKIISGRTPYLFTDKLHEENHDAKTKLSKGHLYDISSNTFAALPEIFSLKRPSDAEKYFRILGRMNNERAYCWIRKDFVRGRVEDYIGKCKIFLPKANGRTGSLGEEEAKLISNPVIGEPSDICTDTFLVVGAFDVRAEAESCLKYIKSKFARVMLGILKATQDNTADKWAKVPLQDFTADSDIDWSGNVDAQLYRKYNLTETEIAFIERHVKEMI